MNLAVTLAQLGDRTLLMDSDLRKPGVRRALNLTIGKEVGLSSYLAGVSTLTRLPFRIRRSIICRLSQLVRCHRVLLTYFHRIACVKRSPNCAIGSNLW